ncbi:MAG: DctP family TRAP transporter solute-binding subunit [Synergistaceae bacterium]|jgi:tripartite ATP-independent transporter DctP family solute receptor|nr:DctP family TRAP transporter solute-binding subunit [Synergistaceae bacterium]
MKKFMSLAAMMCLLTLSCAASSASAPEYTIRVGAVVSEIHADLVAMREVFVPQIETESGGRIKVEVYPNGQLGGDREMTEAVQMGTLHIGMPASSALAGFDKRMQVLDLPYLFTSRESAFNALDGELGKKLEEYMLQKGIFNLAYVENGMRHAMNNRGPIRTPNDMKGLKIRTMENPMHMAYFKELGANPTPLNYGELYTALQQGVVDAAECPYALISDSKFYEVQKYVSETGHIFSVTLLIANKDFIDKLPDDLRAIVIKAGRDYAKAQRKLMAGMEADYKKQIEASGMKANGLTPEEKKPFVDATVKVYAQFEDQLGKEIMDIARKVQK